MLYTILSVREDAVDLFGFADQGELNCFRQLTSVSGVGPKAAVAILSELSPEKVAMAVASGDYKTLTRASGVGPKLAQRIVLEMKDKVGALQPSAGMETPGGHGSGFRLRKRGPGGFRPVGAGLLGRRSLRRRGQAGQRAAGGSIGA